MSAPRSHPDPLRLERLLEVLPDSEALRPVLGQLLASSRPDPGRRWTASGELGTAGGRLVDPAAFEERARAWVSAERGRLERRVRSVAFVASALEAGDVSGVVGAMLDESGALEVDGQAEEAGAWAEAAYRAALEAGDPRASEALRRTARCARSAGRLEEAAGAYEGAWSRALDTGRREDAVVSATGRGNISVDRGRWREAEAWYSRALEVLDAPTPDAVPRDHAHNLRWRIFQNLGITHRERGALDEAEEWYARAEQEAAGLDDPAATVEIENGRGQLELARGSERAAERRFRVALEALTNPQPDAVRVAIRVNLGEALLRQGRSLDAGSAAREAEAEAIEGRHLGRLAEVYRLLARVARARGDDEAFVFVERALEIVRQAALPPVEEALTLLAYAELRDEQGEAEVARAARERAEEIFRSLDITRALDGAEPDDTQRQGGAS